MVILIKFEFEGFFLNGILINEEESYLIIKLASGYNANFHKNSIKILEKNIIKDEIKELILPKNNKNLPKISILHTGGTIASKVDYRTGAVSSKFEVNDLLNLFPELNQKANISAKMIANIFSEDMRFEEYNILMRAIAKEIEDGSEGIIIGHGTDTMHYSAAALQYGMKNLSIPVILVGAQRSSDRASSDAFLNLNAACDFLISQINSEKKFLRVGICMHENLSDNSFLILDSINSKKLHSTRRDAFKQINYLPFARIENSNCQIIRNELLSFKKEEKFDFFEYDTKLKIGFFKVHPNMFSWEFDILKNYDAIILEGTGIGNIPQNESNFEKDENILKSFAKLSKEIKVFSSVQTIYGEVSLDIYSRGRDMQMAGIIGNRHNLISETLLLRVAFCLSRKNLDFDELWNQNLEDFKLESKDI